jgi:hypothetical protein
LISKYEGSPLNLLSTVYPQYEWLPWKFEICKNFWEDIANQRKYMVWAERQLNKKQPSDWYSVTSKVRKK